MPYKCIYIYIYGRLKQFWLKSLTSCFAEVRVLCRVAHSAAILSRAFCTGVVPRHGVLAVLLLTVFVNGMVTLALRLDIGSACKEVGLGDVPGALVCRDLFYSV